MKRFPDQLQGAELPEGLKPKKRGADKHKKSQFKTLICVVMGVTSTGDVVHKIAGYNSISGDTARAVLGRHREVWFCCHH